MGDYFLKEMASQPLPLPSLEGGLETLGQRDAEK